MHRGADHVGIGVGGDHQPPARALDFADLADGEHRASPDQRALAHPR